MKITEVIKFKTDDNVEHETKEDAEKHVLKKELAEFFFNNGDTDIEVHSGDLADFVFQNIDYMRDLIKRYDNILIENNT